MNEVQNWKQWQPVDELLEQVLAADRPRVSIHPLSKLQTNLFRHLCWSAVITEAYLLALLLTPYWQVRIGLLAAAVFNGVIIGKGWLLHRELTRMRLADANLLQLLRQFSDKCRRWEKLQYRLAVIVYPLAIAAGYLLGGALATGLPLPYLLRQPLFGGGLPVAVFLLSGAGFFFARRVFHRQFGQYLQQLETDEKSLRFEV